MLTIRPVIEVRPPGDPAPWPTACQPAWSWLVLDATRTPGEVALFVAAVAASSCPDTVTLDGLLATPDLIVPGGLQVHDTTTGVTVSPGCCCGLQDWRAVARGDDLWLGHDPAPTVQDRGDHLRLWQDDNEQGPHVDIPRTQLPALLESAHRDLNAFLPLIGTWAGDRGPALVAAIDREFTITAPLELPCDTTTPAPPT